MFSLEEVGKCCSENRLLVKNLTAIFSYDVSRALKTMSINKLWRYYLLLEEKDRKLFRNSGLLLTALCLCCSSWLALQMSQGMCPAEVCPTSCASLLLVGFGQENLREEL